MKTIVYSLVLMVTLFSGVIKTWGQIDKTFWFAVPEATSGHGDAPVSLRMAAFGQPATVTISQPANPAFVPIISNIPANSATAVDLTPFLASLENIPGDAVLNKGLKIVSTAEITAYYEIITSCQCNPEIFALKGKNALGTSFYTPFQTLWNNGGYGPQPTASVDIVATNNNTIVTITPTVDVVGHTAGIAYTVTLNEGETYSMVATNPAGIGHPAGTHITSNLPIAVTIKDDSVANGGCADIMGDQMIPTDIIGKEYIAMKGFLSPGAGEGVFILATENNTNIFIDGNTTAAATINTGQQFYYALVNNTTYIKTDKPAYVLHATGEGCELAEAVLPPIQCTGSEKVYFIRSVDGAFGVNIMTETANINAFTLNGSNTLIPAASFQPVPGTNGAWMSTQILFSTTDIPSGQFTVVENTSGLFHLGIINGGGGGCRYGYFSNFDQADPINNEDYLCEGSTFTITTNDEFLTYQWSTGETTPTIDVTEPGMYWVSVTSDMGCDAIDTIQMNQWNDPDIDISFNDTVLCGWNTFTLLEAPNIPFVDYTWIEDGMPIGNTPSIVADLGTYELLVTDNNGCTWRSLSPTVVDFEICPIYIPNIYTPDESMNSLDITLGNNSFFVQNLFYYPGSILSIYNRWGHRVYHSEDYKNDWTGEGLNEGTYYYVLQVTYPDNTTQSYAGDVLLMR